MTRLFEYLLLVGATSLVAVWLAAPVWSAVTLGVAATHWLVEVEGR